MNGAQTRKKNNIYDPAVAALTVICILLNILLSLVVRTTTLPFYIDTVGTIVATALGGTVPGILTAFTTNAVNFFMDGESIYYASLNMLIAILSAAYFGDYASYRTKILRQKRKEAGEQKKRSFFDVLLYVLCLSLIGGGLGGEITWYLYGSPSDAPLSVSIMSMLSEQFGIGEWGCHMIATYLTDTLDKAISVAIALGIVHLVPESLRTSVRLSPWKQKPLTLEEQLEAEKRRRAKLSIGTRINLILILSTALMTVVSLVYFAISSRRSTIETLSDSAQQIAFLAARTIDPEMIDTYLAEGEQANGYIAARDRLYTIKNSTTDIAFLYVYKPEADGCHVVFDLNTILRDGSYFAGDRPGSVVPYEEAFAPYQEAMMRGELLPTLQVEDRYGTFLAAYYPIYSRDGTCVAYAVSNVEYKLVGIQQMQFFGRVLLLFSGFFILILTVSILTTKYNIIMPILSMTVYADEIADLGSGANEESLEKVEALDIRTGDEMEQLYRAFCKMTGDTVYRLNENQSQNEAIAKMQEALIVTMADMVENRDSDNGNHVLKTSAYVRIILKGLQRNGYYAEKISDKYIRDVEMSAPLHDVGMIKISDTILDKPEKLTPQEREIMQTHTTAGREILENAISSMEGDNYLKEARNMATYHHERWDGTGYPEGLHGEVIPLSARVMALADVFDALTSARIYKPAYPFEESVQTIREGAGTQFDPKCVEVFLEQIAEIRKVYVRYQD